MRIMLELEWCGTDDEGVLMTPAPNRKALARFYRVNPTMLQVEGGPLCGNAELARKEAEYDVGAKRVP